MSRLLPILALALGLIAATVPESGLAAPAASGRTVNATQQRENRTNADRWSRESSASSKKTEHGDKEDDEHKADDARHDKDEAPKHPGELNGKLDLGDW